MKGGFTRKGNTTPLYYEESDFFGIAPGNDLMYIPEDGVKWAQTWLDPDRDPSNGGGEWVARSYEGDNHEETGDQSTIRWVPVNMDPGYYYWDIDEDGSEILTWEEGSWEEFVDNPLETFNDLYETNHQFAFVTDLEIWTVSPTGNSALYVDDINFTNPRITDYFEGDKIQYGLKTTVKDQTNDTIIELYWLDQQSEYAIIDGHEVNGSDIWTDVDGIVKYVEVNVPGSKIGDGNSYVYLWGTREIIIPMNADILGALDFIDSTYINVDVDNCYILSDDTIGDITVIMPTGTHIDNFEITAAMGMIIQPQLGAYSAAADDTNPPVIQGPPDLVFDSITPSTVYWYITDRNLAKWQIYWYCPNRRVGCITDNGYYCDCDCMCCCIAYTVKSSNCIVINT
ncbi:hypothetical protein ES703_96836 [subsurface metagenome]